MSEFVVRPMSEHDLLEVVEIEESSGLSRWGWEGYYDELLKPEAVAFVAERAARDVVGGRRIIGFIVARLIADELHVNNIAVRAERRGRGAGSALLARALDEGRALGARAARLEVRASNEAAQSLYVQHGFVLCGRRKLYYSQPAEDALEFCADLMTLPSSRK